MPRPRRAAARGKAGASANSERYARNGHSLARVSLLTYAGALLHGLQKFSDAVVARPRRTPLAIFFGSSPIEEVLAVHSGTALSAWRGSVRGMR